MRGLKVIVIVLGVMIVVTTGVIIAVIVGRLSKHAGPGTPAGAPAGAPAPRPFAAAPIAIAPGARIEAMTTGPDRLVVALALPDGGHRILVIDLATGARIGTIALTPAP